MARQRVKPSEGEIVTWFSRFWKPDPARTSPEIRPKGNRFELIGAPPKGDAAAPPPPIVSDTPPAPVEPSPTVPEKAGPPPRMIRFLGGRVYEEGENGKLYLASDDGDFEESIERKYYRQLNADINFEGGGKRG